MECCRSPIQHSSSASFLIFDSIEINQYILILYALNVSTIDECRSICPFYENANFIRAVPNISGVNEDYVDLECRWSIVYLIDYDINICEWKMPFYLDGPFNSDDAALATREKEDYVQFVDCFFHHRYQKQSNCFILR